MLTEFNLLTLTDPGRLYPQERTLESHQCIAASQDKWLDGQIVGWARFDREAHHRRVSA